MTKLATHYKNAMSNALLLWVNHFKKFWILYLRKYNSRHSLEKLGFSTPFFVIDTYPEQEIVKITFHSFPNCMANLNYIQIEIMMIIFHTYYLSYILWYCVHLKIKMWLLSSPWNPLYATAMSLLHHTDVTRKTVFLSC